MKNQFTRLLFTTCVVVMSFTTLSGQAWTLLGSSKVHGHKDYDEISVTASRGDFKAIKLFVENEGINFDRVVVHYKNGNSERMVINNFIPAGGETRVMDLAGGDRVIHKVTFYYKSNAMTSTKGKVVLYGRR
jgi:hypothetical protein